MTIKISFTEEQDKTFEWFQKLRDDICIAFEQLELELVNNSLNLAAGKFERKDWNRPGGGGGVMSLMKGRVFEKVGVNISRVYGEFSEEFRKQIPGTDKCADFFACGISLVAHMRSPLVPAVHFNTRYITTGKTWFGGGMDLTPMVLNNDDSKLFHDNLRQMCNRHDSSYYKRFSQECDEYFYLPHRGESRGIGGIFYDYLNTGDFTCDFAFTQDVGRAFLETYQFLVRKHMNESWSDEEREIQLIKRGRYAEFNLLYDRGTKFGLMTGGNVEAILMSLPPVVKWS